MNVVTYQQESNLHMSLSNFLDLLFASKMKFLSSDLLYEGMSIIEIQSAVKKAMVVCKMAKLELRKHFLPVYTEIEGTLIKDCKLSRMGYGLVLLNIQKPNITSAMWQINVLQEFFNRLD